MDEYFSRRQFEKFKSEVCHRIKNLGNIRFLIEVLESDFIMQYWEAGQHVQSLYLLSVTDYLSRLEEVPLCSRYHEIRCMRIDPPIYSVSEELYCKIMGVPLEREETNYIPEFVSHGIMEGDLFRVC